jgi:tetratricopeptide (TPR) repeat protein
MWGALLVLVAALGYRQFDSTDAAVHILAGREILATHRIPDADPFSFTVRGAPWFVNQWIPEVLFALVERSAGIAGLVWLRALLLVATFAVLARAVRGDPRVRSGPALAGLLLSLYASQNLFIMRPLLFTCLFLAIEVLVLEAYRRGGRDRLLALVPLFALWVNCHAGYLFGAILFAAVIAGESAKALARGRLGAGPPLRRVARLAAVFAGALVASAAMASLVNPRGFATVLLPFGLAKNTFFLSMIGEYEPAGASDWVFFVAAALLFAGLVRALISRGGREIDVTDWCVALPFAYQAWRTHRVVLPFAIVAAPALARSLERLARDVEAAAARLAGQARGRVPAAARRAAPWACALALAAAAAARAAAHPTFDSGLSHVTYPRAACLRFLREGRFEGNLFHNDVWAGAVALFGYPRYRLFIDGRLEVYGEAFWRDVYFRILGCGPGWEEALARYGVNAALLRTGSPAMRDRIGSVLRVHPEWALVYWDETAMLYVRRIPQHAALIERYAVPSEVDPENVAVPASSAARTRFLEAMDRALAEDAGSIPALYGAVAASLADGARDVARAARYLPLARAAARSRLGRADWRLPWLESRILLATGDPAGAAEALRRSARAGGSASEEVLFDRMAAAVALGRGDEAAKLLARGASRVASVRGRRGGEARRAEARVFALGGRVLARAGDHARARDAYAEAARRDPARSDYAAARAWSFVLEGRAADAVRAADAALGDFPSDPYLIGTRGWARFLTGDPARAEADLRAALARLPAADVAARAAESAHLAEVLLARGSRDEVLDLLASATADTTLPSLPEVTRARALLDSLAAGRP